MSTKVTDLIGDAAVKSTPPIGISILGATMHLEHWVYIATFIYIVLQIVVIIPKVINVFKRRRSNDKAS